MPEIQLSSGLDLSITNRKDAKHATADPVNSSSSLVPEIQIVLTNAGLTVADIDLIAIAVGPGSFTSLRNGIVAAKTFAYVTGCNIVGVNVMDAIAWQAADWQRGQLPFSGSMVIAVAIKIGRGEVCAASYEMTPGQPFPVRQLADPSVEKPDRWLNSLKTLTLITGNGIELLNDSVLADSRLAIMPATVREPNVETVARLGVAKFLNGGSADFWTLQPIYSRPSAAEEVRNRQIS